MSHSSLGRNTGNTAKQKLLWWCLHLKNNRLSASFPQAALHYPKEKPKEQDLWKSKALSHTTLGKVCYFIIVPRFQSALWSLAYLWYCCCFCCHVWVCVCLFRLAVTLLYVARRKQHTHKLRVCLTCLCVKLFWIIPSRTSISQSPTSSCCNLLKRPIVKLQCIRALFNLWTSCEHPPLVSLSHWWILVWRLLWLKKQPQVCQG